MTTAAAPLRMSGLITPARSTAQSPSGRKLVEMREDIRNHLLTSIAIAAPAEQVLARLEEVRSEASAAGWDGYGARPLHPFSYVYARFFVNALPATAPTPEVSADSDGEVSLDWFFGERKALTVSIGPTGRCTFAWMNGQSSFRGTEWMEDDIPASIAFALGQLSRAAGGR